jgi:glutamyl-tRNA reductase
VNVLALGLNHGTAPLDLRARVALPADRLVAEVQQLRDRVAEAARSPVEATLLSTCNRTELYLGLPSTGSPLGQRVADAGWDWLANLGGLAVPELQRHGYQHNGAAAARHAFRVACGLDSMVLGETQILGQLKRAVQAASGAGALGGMLHQLFQRSFAVAKAVRTGTPLGAQSVSLPAACARLAEQVFGDLREARVLLVGAGEMNEAVGVYLAARGPQRLEVLNRSLPRAQALCDRLRRQWPAGDPQWLVASPLSRLPAALAEHDVIVSCTASTLPLIGLGAVQAALRQRRHRPLMLFDLAVPPDVEPQVRSLPDAYVYGLDDMQARVAGAGAARQAAVREAEALVEEGVDGFGRWLQQRGQVPLIRAVQAQADVWRQSELVRARRALARGDDPAQVLEAMSGALVRKLLHGAMAELQGPDAAADGARADLLGRLFLGGSRRAP